MTTNESQQPERTPEYEQEVLLTRMIHDGVIAQRGGAVDVDGVLHPAADHRAELYDEGADAIEAANIARREAYAKTPEGKQSAEALKGLINLSQMIGVHYLHHVGPMGSMEDGKFVSPWADFDAEAFIADNGLTQVDTRLIEGLALSPDGLEGLAERAVSATTDEYADRLMALDDHLSRYSDYHIGNTVKVVRNGKDGNPPYAESGWRIDSILASGYFRLVNDALGFQKDASLSHLDSANGTPRTMVAPPLEV